MAGTSPSAKTDTAVVLETKASKIALGASQVKELLKNIRIMNAKYEHVVGILYNGESTRVFKNGEEYKEKGVKSSTTSPTTRPCSTSTTSTSSASTN